LTVGTNIKEVEG